jgi:hypothetical protein
MCDFTHSSETLMRWWNKRQTCFQDLATCDIEEDLVMQCIYSTESRKRVELTIQRRRARLDPAFYSIGMTRTEEKQLRHIKWYTSHESRIQDKINTLVDKHTFEACPNCKVRHAAQVEKYHANVAKREAKAAKLAEEQVVEQAYANAVKIEV